MLDAFRKWMFGRTPAQKYGGVYAPTVLPGDPANMAAQMAASASVALDASRPTYNLNYKQERPVRRPQQTNAQRLKLLADEKAARDRRRREDDSTSSTFASSLATDMAISSAFDTGSSWSSSDSSSSWSSDSSSSGSDFSGGGGSFGGGGADGSW